MKREKSCGAVVYRYNNDVLELLLIRHRFGGHWSFPKGHVEEGENEFQTALREVKEETNLSIRLRDGFRESVEYFPKPYIKKQVVYFLGLSLGDTPKRQEEEISELRWVPIDDAERMVTFANDKNLISRSREYLKINGPE
ncbi:MAG: NUDIX domain-containing protein [Oscillospiraceae bacterium]|nr:NUDIX domain-containing protein [Oscillospiraceae bacterium]